MLRMKTVMITIIVAASASQCCLIRDDDGDKDGACDDNYHRSILRITNGA